MPKHNKSIVSHIVDLAILFGAGFLIAIAGYVIFSIVLKINSIEPNQSNSVYRDSSTIVIDSTITRDTLVDVENLYAPEVNSILIRSTGGYVTEGLAIANFVKEHDLSVYASDYCHSICTIIFVSGKDRLITKNTKFGFHAPGWDFKKDNYSKSEISSLIGDMNGYVGAMVKLYIDGGLSSNLIKQILNTPYSKAMYLDSQELIEAGVAKGILKVD